MQFSPNVLFAAQEMDETTFHGDFMVTSGILTGLITLNEFSWLSVDKSLLGFYNDVTIKKIVLRK